MLFGVLDRYHAAGENLRREGGGRGPPSPFFYVNFNATLREGWEGRPKDCRHPSYKRGGGLCPRSLLDVPEH